MKKKLVILSSAALSLAALSLSLVAVGQNNLVAKAEFDEPVSHQIILRAENTSAEKEDVYTRFFALHKDNATRSGYPIDSTPEECIIMADGDRGAGGSQICFGEANPASGTYASLVLTIPLTNIESFTNVVLRGKFYRGYRTDMETELQYGSERYFGNEFYVHLSHEFREIILYEIEINYTCAK